MKPLKQGQPLGYLKESLLHQASKGIAYLQNLNESEHTS